MSLEDSSEDSFTHATVIVISYGVGHRRILPSGLGKCHRVGYCSVSCQKAAWLDHKLECRSLAALGRDDELVPKLMLAARVLRGRRRGDPDQERVAALHAGGSATKGCRDLAAMGLAVPHLMPTDTTPEELATLLHQFDQVSGCHAKGPHSNGPSRSVARAEHPLVAHSFAPVPG